MPISFANPALLFGALAAALPVIIHLISRRKVQRRLFSDLRFLDEVQARSSRSLGVKRWLLLLLRVLALLLIALAAAQPRWGGVAAAGRGARSVLFVLDSSASMQTTWRNGTRFDAARGSLAEMIRALPDGASVQVITAGAVVEPLFGDWLPAGAVAAGLDELDCTDGAFDLPATLRETARQISRAPGTPVEVVLVSDLQAAAEGEGAAAAIERLNRTAPSRLLVRRVGEAVGGGGVLGVAIPGRTVLAGEKITLAATVAAQFEEQVFWLDLDGRIVAEAVFEGPAATEPDSATGAVGEAIGTIRFPVTVPANGIHRGRIRKESDAAPFDDVRPFVLKVPAALNVLLVHGADRPVDGSAGRGGWRYLAKALDPGGGAGAFRVAALPTADLTTGALNRSDVAVFVNPDPFGRQALAGLTDWLSSGGAALFVLGEPTQAGYLESTLLPALGLPTGTRWQVQDAGQRVHIVDPAHVVFGGLEEAAVRTLGEVKYRRWFRLDEGQARVLLTLTGEDPLLVEGELGAGTFAVLAADLLPRATDLAASPMALPFFQRLAAWLANRSRLTDAANLTVGAEAVVRPSGGISLENSDELLFIRNEAPPRAAALRWLAGEPVLSAGPLRHGGFVTFLAAGDTVGVIAAGVPAAESTLALRTVGEWTARMRSLGLPVAGDLSSVEAGQWLRVLEGRDLTAWFLLLAFALLVVESVIGRGARAAEVGTEGG